MPQFDYFDRLAALKHYLHELLEYLAPGSPGLHELLDYHLCAEREQALMHFSARCEALALKNSHWEDLIDVLERDVRAAREEAEKARAAEKLARE
jgi:hypothetical protein